MGTGGEKKTEFLWEERIVGKVKGVTPTGGVLEILQTRCHVERTAKKKKGGGGGQKQSCEKACANDFGGPKKNSLGTQSANKGGKPVAE